MVAVSVAVFYLVFFFVSLTMTWLQAVNCAFVECRYTAVFGPLQQQQRQLSVRLELNALRSKSMHMPLSS